VTQAVLVGVETGGFEDEASSLLFILFLINGSWVKNLVSIVKERIKF
jgi:hypothetical protein